MKVQVYTPEEEASLAFDSLIKDATKELHLGRLIDEVLVRVELDPFLFYISVKKNPSPPSVRTSDILEITEETEDVVKIVIVDEIYAPHLLSLLWDKFGDEKVRQIRRSILEVEATRSEILNLPIHQLKEKEIDSMIQDFIHRVIPAGLRIVRKLGVLTYIASENTITDQNIELMKELVSKSTLIESNTDEGELIEDTKEGKMK
ncbi:MAG: methanogenesis marker 17 protein [Halobacteriota archaeon]|nr:methanogenesis marker 17 protein [Halobacteriota archaeon]